MTEAASGAALAALLHELARVQRCNAERAANPELARALAHLRSWQSRRLRMTYADLEASPRYAPAMQFFETDLYGGGDFARRDADLIRVVPAMKRLLPAGVIAAVATAVALNALSQELDRALIDELGSPGDRFGVAEYCAAYRRMGRHDCRERQIRLIGEVGVTFDRYVRKPMIRGALVLMRKPARVGGLAALQDFLERGFSAFVRMRGAAEFLATIERRESAIHAAIISGADTPFPDPGA